MPRPEKVQAVAEIKERIADAQAVFVTEFRGLSVKQLQQLRRSLRASGADYKVVKMTLARRAADEAGIEGIGDHLAGPTALTFANVDAVATAKTLRDARRENENVVIKAGILRGGQVIPPEQVSRLAEIEPREVLLAQIAGAAKAPLNSMARMLGSFTRGAATMFSQLLEKRQADEPAAAEPEQEEAPATDEAVPAAETSTDPTPADEAPADQPGVEATDEDEPAESAEEE